MGHIRADPTLQVLDLEQLQEVVGEHSPSIDAYIHLGPRKDLNIQKEKELLRLHTNSLLQSKLLVPMEIVEIPRASVVL